MAITAGTSIAAPRKSSRGHHHSTITASTSVAQAIRSVNRRFDFAALDAAEVVRDRFDDRAGQLREHDQHELHLPVRRHDLRREERDHRRREIGEPGAEAQDFNQRAGGSAGIGARFRAPGASTGPRRWRRRAASRWPWPAPSRRTHRRSGVRAASTVMTSVTALPPASAAPLNSDCVWRARPEQRSRVRSYRVTNRESSFTYGKP